MAFIGSTCSGCRLVQKAADLGDPEARGTLCTFVLHGNAGAAVARDAARDSQLLSQAFAQAYGRALCQRSVLLEWRRRGGERCAGGDASAAV
jgi:acyl-CoA reductase-like NAD-dependent aldehyde dehydrogenase